MSTILHILPNNTHWLEVLKQPGNKLMPFFTVLRVNLTDYLLFTWLIYRGIGKKGKNVREE